jgi:hypothetical protein
MRLKRINPNAILYHYFQMTPVKSVLFDDDMDMPVAYGSKNLVEGTITHLSKNVTVIYYKRNVDKQTFYNPRFLKYEGKAKETESEAK